MPVRTNVTRLLDARRIPYTPVTYDADRFHSAEEVAALIGVPPARVFKTIVVLRDEPGRRPLLVLVPAGTTIDLRRLAAALGAKRLRIAPRHAAETLTRLQIGGISALALIGRPFDVLLDRSAARFAEEGIYVSGGRRGLNLCLRPDDLLALVGGAWVEAVTTDPAAADGA
jgi:Cys-tRNA(Pro)/Cys-tRNA(Cys) deacylase